MANKDGTYPSDVSDEEWAFCAPYFTLMKEDAPQREHGMRAVFNALRWMVRARCSWRMMPHEFSPWTVVNQQTQRWIKAGCFEAMAHDLREVLRIGAGKDAGPTAVIIDSRTIQSTPSSGAEALTSNLPTTRSSAEIYRLVGYVSGKLLESIGRPYADERLALGEGIRSRESIMSRSDSFGIR